MRTVSLAGVVVFKLIAKPARSAAVIRLALMGGVFCGIGCSGSATIQFVSLHASEIDPPPAKPWEYDAQEAYWWIDEAGALNISFRCRRRNLFLGGLGDVELIMSLVPGPPPAGTGRNYNIRRRETRTVLTTGFQFQRFSSYAGIMNVIMKDEDHIRGSFRIWLKPHEKMDFFSFIPHTPGSFVCFGTYRAVRDETRGKAIRQQCESGGWQRIPRHSGTTSRPTTETSYRARLR
ncbi:MAG: hypothetical protein MI923_07725 [Phycisphaerales bacterium]|nr:hypothetical protein [Phycisphaerales bacterium]